MAETSESAHFLLAEFNALQQRAAQHEQSKSNGVNFFLIVVAATIAGFATLVKDLSVQGYLPFGLAIAAFTIMILGLATLEHLINLSTAQISLYRYSGRIRRWFSERDDGLSAYIAFEANDDRPSMDIPQIAFRGADPVVVTVNSAAGAIFVASLAALWSLIGAVISLLVVAVAMVLVQRSYTHWKLKRAAKFALRGIRFPST